MRLVFILLLAASNFAATYYVDPAGNNSNDGSIGSPFLTIQKGSDTATSPGDVVCINDGTYIASFTKYGNPGTEANPITFRNCEGGGVFIDLSSARGTTWTNLGTNLWESDNLAASSTSLFFRDTTYLGRVQASCATVDAQDEWCVSTNGRLETYNTSNPSGFTYRRNSGSVEIRNTSYVVLDLENILIGYGRETVQIGYYGTAPTGETSNITIKNGEVAYTGSRSIRVIGSNLYPTTYVTIDNMSVHGAHDPNASPQNGHCIKMDSSEDGYHNGFATVSNSEIYDCEYMGIQFSDGWHDGTFFNNEIYDISQRGAGVGAAIRCGDVYNCFVYDNELHGGSSGLGTGMYFQELANPSLVYRNRIHDFDSSGISIFKVVKTPGDLYIYNNLIYDNDTSGISIFNSSSVYIYNNTFYNNDGYQINATNVNAMGVEIKNNIIYHDSTDFALGLASANGFEESNNLLYNSASNIISWDASNYNVSGYQTASGQGSGTIQTHPLFTDAPSDLSLTSGSPAINGGTNVADVLITDYVQDFRPQGANFDMGAYEYPISGYGMKAGSKILNGAKFKPS